VNREIENHRKKSGRDALPPRSAPHAEQPSTTNRHQGGTCVKR
jgi:hypothetical protein